MIEKAAVGSATRDLVYVGPYRTDFDPLARKGYRS